MLERIGISLEHDLLKQFDRLIAEKGYVNRSEAVRDLIRESLVQREWAEDAGRAKKVAVVAVGGVGRTAASRLAPELWCIPTPAVREGPRSPSSFLNRPIGGDLRDGYRVAQPAGAVRKVRYALDGDGPDS